MGLSVLSTRLKSCIKHRWTYFWLAQKLSLNFFPVISLACLEILCFLGGGVSHRKTFSLQNGCISSSKCFLRCWKSILKILFNYWFPSILMWLILCLSLFSFFPLFLPSLLCCQDHLGAFTPNQCRKENTNDQIFPLWECVKQHSQVVRRGSSPTVFSMGTDSPWILCVILGSTIWKEC